MLSAISSMPVMMCFQDPPRVESLNHTWIPHVNNLRSKLIDGKRRSRTRWGRHPLHRHQPTDRRAQRLYERKYCQRGRMENLLKPQASPGLRSDLLHESLRQPSPALSAWRRLLVALDVPEPHAEALALARGPVRHPAQQADQARHRGHRNGRSHSDRPGPGVPGRGYPHRRLDAPRPVRHLSAGPCARTQEPVPVTPNPPPHLAIETGPRGNRKT